MRVRVAIQSLAFVWLFVGSCFAHHTAVIVNKSNQVEKVASAQLAKMVRGEVKKWPDGNNITLVLHRVSSGETATLEHLNKMTAAEWKAFLALHQASIMFVETDADVIRAVQADPGALGFIEVPSIDNSVNVVRVDGKLPMESGYLPH